MERIPEFIANHLFLVCLLIAILMLLAWNLFGDSLSGIKSLPPQEVTRLINRDDARVIDLRGRSEFEAGHIIDALNIDAAQLQGQLEKLKKYKQQGLIICCATGGRLGAGGAQGSCARGLTRYIPSRAAFMPGRMPACRSRRAQNSIQPE